MNHQPEGGNVTKELENLRWKPAWVSYLACIDACLAYLGREVSRSWLYGGTGHAFVINIHEVVCPSGPTAWNSEMIAKLGQNLGYTLRSVWGTTRGKDFDGLQKRAWEHARKAIDEGLPCFAWELEIPEYYVVYGYDDIGYYHAGPRCHDGTGPKPWRELGKSEIGVLELCSMKLSEPADDATIVKQALSFALEHAESPEKWIFPKYKAGLEGFDVWIRSVEDGTAHGFGLPYNAAVWEECRRRAAEFLEEAGSRIGGDAMPLFEKATRHYRAVAGHLKEVSTLYPFSKATDATIAVDDKSNAAAAVLRKAKDAEKAGLDTLAEIVALLG
jgi:hypothetical protein